MVSMAEPKTLATRGVLAVLIALGLSAVLFVYTGSIPLMSEMEARPHYLAGEEAPAKAIETTTTVTLIDSGEGLSVTTETVYTAPAERLDAVTQAVTVATVTKTVTMNVTVTVTKTSP